MKKTVYFILQHLCTGGVEICVTNVANAFKGDKTKCDKLSYSA